MLYPINPKILHKSSSDDVLIKNALVPLPEYIDTTTFLGVEALYPQIAKLYRNSDLHCLRFSEVDELIETARNGVNGRDLHDREKWLKQRAVPYQLLSKVRAISEDEICALSTELVKLTCEPMHPRRSSSYQFSNDASHYFFYRKTHDHVPGIMLIEAQRQAIYHHIYSSTSWILGEVTVSLNSLEANFFGYANLMFPIEIVVDDLAETPSFKPRKVSYRVSFYQQAKLIAIIDTDATIITIDNFKKIRNTFMHSGDWFTPIENQISCQVSEFSNETSKGAEFKVRLLGVSKSGIRLEPNIEMPKQTKEIRITIANKDGKTFSAKAVRDTAASEVSYWRFDDEKNDELLMLGMIVASGCVSAAASSAQ